MSSTQVQENCKERDLVISCKSAEWFCECNGKHSQGEGNMMPSAGMRPLLHKNSSNRWWKKSFLQQPIATKWGLFHCNPICRKKKQDTKKGMQFADNNPHLQLFHACSKSRFQFTREGKRKKMPKKMTPNKNGGAICCWPTTPNCNLVLALQYQFHLWRRNSKWEITDWTHIFCATNGRILSFDIYGTWNWKPN